MDLVRLSGDRLIVSSLDISNHFGKQHKDVLRAVDNLECSDEFRRRNFAPTVYHRPNPSGGKGIEARMYEITRDGFVFLCMGFSGQQAATWKERYIEAFNKMEAALRAPAPAARPDPAALQLAHEVGQLRDLVAEQSRALLALYERLDGARVGQLKAVQRLAVIRQRQAGAEATATVLRMLAEGYSRADIAAATGKTLNHIRQISFKARAAGTLPPLPDHPADSTGDLFAQGGAA